jgi:uncharacterized membrane protein
MGRFGRLLRHWASGARATDRAFPQATLDAITAAVGDAESRHSGEIRVAVESHLPTVAVWAGRTSRERAIDLFSQLRVWDTEHNNGVLIYVLLADRVVEIVADRGVAGGRVASGEWDAVCALMRSHFAAGRFREGAVAGVHAVAAVLARYPAGPADVGNEMPDAPVVLR